MYCTYCGQEFSRAEHLERHVLTRKSYLVTRLPPSNAAQDIKITAPAYSRLTRITL